MVMLFAGARMWETEECTSYVVSKKSYFQIIPDIVFQLKWHSVKTIISVLINPLRPGSHCGFVFVHLQIFFYHLRYLRTGQI